MSAEAIVALIDAELGIPCTYSEPLDNPRGQYICETEGSENDFYTYIKFLIETNREDGVILFGARFQPSGALQSFNKCNNIAMMVAELVDGADTTENEDFVYETLQNIKYQTGIFSVTGNTIGEVRWRIWGAPEDFTISFAPLDIENDLGIEI